MFGGGALTEAFTLKSLVGGGGKTGALNKLKGVDAGGGCGGSGCGGLGPPSKKSSIVGKLGGSPPGPKRFELLLLLLLLLLFLFEKRVFIPLSQSNLFLLSNSFPGWLGNDLRKSLSDCFFNIYFSQETSYYWIFCIEC